MENQQNICSSCLKEGHKCNNCPIVAKWGYFATSAMVAYLNSSQDEQKTIGEQILIADPKCQFALDDLRKDK